MEISNLIIYLILDQDLENWQICMGKIQVTRKVMGNEKAGVEFSDNTSFRRYKILTQVIY